MARKTKAQKKTQQDLVFWIGFWILAGFIWFLTKWVEFVDSFGFNDTTTNIIYWSPLLTPVILGIIRGWIDDARNKKFRERVANNPELQRLDRMFVYAWEDRNTPGEIKFGEHWVNTKTLNGGINDTKNYIRNSLGRLRHKFDRGDIIIHTILDASEYAKINGRFRKNSKVDDLIRKNVLSNRIGRSEFHKMSSFKLVENVKKETGYL